MDNDPSLVGLRTVCEVARRGSFSAAAAALGYTQSAVSRQVAHVEQAVGRALFERHARGAQLTPAGELLTRHAASALAELQAARLALADLDGRRQPRVRLGAFSTAMAALVPDALGALAHERPAVRVVLNEGISERLTDRLEAGRLDLALITVRAQPPDGLVLDVLLEDPLLVALPRTHPLAGRGPIDPSCSTTSRGSPAVRSPPRRCSAPGRRDTAARASPTRSVTGRRRSASSPAASA